MDRIKASHGFVNKLWNAAKFVLMACEGRSEDEMHALAAAELSSHGAQQHLPLAERWILGALHQVSLCLSSKPASKLCLRIQAVAQELLACEGRSRNDAHALAAADLSSHEAQQHLPLAERWVLGALHQVSPQAHARRSSNNCSTHSKAAKCVLSVFEGALGTDEVWLMCTFQLMKCKLT